METNSIRGGPWHAGALALLACLAVVFATPGEPTWIVDNGSKALLAHRLLESGYTSMNLGHPAANLAPSGLAFPGAGFVVPAGGRFLSVFPPAFAALAAPFLAWLGPLGLRVPAALGVAASAWLFAAWLAPVLGRRHAIAAGLLLALGTPIFFYGVTIWEHSLTVAASLAAWRCMSAPTPRRAVLAGLLLGASCWLREEMLLMAVAVAAASVWVERRSAPACWLLGGTTVAVGALVAFNTLAFGDPLGVHLRANLPTPDTVARSAETVARQAAGLLAGYGKTGAEAAGLSLGLIVSACAGWLAVRLGGPWRTLLWIAPPLGLAAWGFGTCRMPMAASPLGELVRYNGFLVQMPMTCLAGAGLAWLGQAPAAGELRLGIASGLLFLALALAFGIASQSYFGFGVHWGPRALLPAVPALAALFWLALGDGGWAWRVAWSALAAAGLLSSGLSVWFLNEQKAEGERLQAAILARPTDALATTHPYLAQQLPRLWRSRQVALIDRPETLRRIALAVARKGGHEVHLIVSPDQGALGKAAGLHCALESSHRGERLHYLDLDVYRCFVAIRRRR